MVTRASTVPVPAGEVGAHELAEHDADHRQLSGSRGDRSARIRSSPEWVRARLTQAQPFSGGVDWLRAVDVVPGAPARFGPVHGQIGVVEQLVGVDSGTGGERDADAGGDGQVGTRNGQPRP